MRILIVDDEPLARQRLASLVERADLGDLVGQASNGAEALEASKTEAPDVVLLDIRMPGMDGLEVARHLAGTERPPAVIFTTAYDTHALEAFEAHAVDYLLKPIRQGRLMEALARARQPTRAQLAGLGGSQLSAASARTHISATLQGNLKLMPVREVRYFRAEHKYVSARSAEEELVLDESLSELKQEFGQRFLQVHRNALVALEHVTILERDGSGGQFVCLDGVDQRIQVSRRLAARVKRVLKQRTEGL